MSGKRLNSGWLELHTSHDTSVRVMAKFVTREGRRVFVRLVVDGGITSQSLRNIRLGQHEAILNSRQGADRQVLLPDGDGEIEAAVSTLLASADGVGRVDRLLPLTRDRLTRPDGTDADGFSRRVARAYADAVATTHAPAKVLAEEAGVPVGTAHRWIREARQRGHIAPGRKGAVG